LRYFVIFLEKVGVKAKRSSNEVNVDSKEAREIIETVFAEPLPDYSDDSEDDDEFEKEIKNELHILQRTGLRLKFFAFKKYISFFRISFGCFFNNQLIETNSLRNTII
jgi:hypothetical protein